MRININFKKILGHLLILPEKPSIYVNLVLKVDERRGILVVGLICITLVVSLYRI